MLRNKPHPAAVFGVDIGKNVFHVVGADAAGAVVQKAKFRRDTLLRFFEAAEGAVVAMEACPGSQWLARKLVQLGHTVRIIPAQFVKPYVKSNKSDIIDAEAIAEAVTRPTMRFVEIKSRDPGRYPGAAPRAGSQGRRANSPHLPNASFLSRIWSPHSSGTLASSELDFPRVLANEENDLTPTMRRTARPAVR